MYKIWKDEPFNWAPTRKLGTKGWIAHASSPSAPPAPDYTGAANATAKGNLDAARAQTTANRVDQTNPWGSTSYTQGTGFDQSGYDAALAKYNGEEAALDANPNGSQLREYQKAVGQVNTAPVKTDFMQDPDHWTQTTTLNPELQSALNSQLRIQNTRSSIAENQLAGLQDNYKTAFKAPELTSYLSGVKDINQDSVNTKDYTGNLEQSQTTGRDAASYQTNTNSVNQNAPQFDPNNAAQYQKAAYDAGSAFVEPQNAADMKKLRESLALQGLSPGTEAAYNGTKSLSDSQQTGRNQLASQSLLTGAAIGQGNYASQLSGFNASNAAQNQKYTQGISAQAADLSTLQVNNAGRQNNYGNALQEAGLQQSNNTAANTARQQAYANALSRYQTQYAADYTARTLPLNEMNALLTGQQVSSPAFAAYNGQGQTTGADATGAATASGNYAQGVANREAAAASATNSSAAGLAGAGIGAWGAAAGAGLVAF